MSARDGLELRMADDEYRDGPELSYTGMKWLLRSPKHYAERMAHRVEKPQFDFGHAVHAKVLGVGMDTVRIPDEVLASNGAASTKAAKEFIDQARADGLVPLKGEVLDRVEATAGAVLANAKAASLLTRSGDAEVSAFATDPETRVRLRGRIDWLAATTTGQMLPVDLKTTTDVRRHHIRRAVETFGYDVQAATYRHLLRLITREDPAPMHLIFVEVDPPHEVRVVSLAHEDWLLGGETKMRTAIETFARCIETDTWPGDDDLTSDIEALDPRPYYLSDALGEDEEVELVLP